MQTLIVTVILLGILGGVIAYLIRAKKAGQKCIGCPSGGSCSGNCNGCGKH